MDNKIMHPEWEIVERGGYTDLFPISLAIAMKIVAGANSIPYAAMISGALAFMCTFSPTCDEWATAMRQATKIEPGSIITDF